MSYYRGDLQVGEINVPNLTELTELQIKGNNKLSKSIGDLFGTINNIQQNKLVDQISNLESEEDISSFLKENPLSNLSDLNKSIILSKQSKSKSEKEKYNKNKFLIDLFGSKTGEDVLNILNNTDPKNLDSNVIENAFTLKNEKDENKINNILNNPNVENPANYFSEVWKVANLPNNSKNKENIVNQGIDNVIERFANRDGTIPFNLNTILESNGFSPTQINAITNRVKQLNYPYDSENDTQIENDYVNQYQEQILLDKQNLYNSGIVQTKKQIEKSKNEIKSYSYNNVRKELSGDAKNTYDQLVNYAKKDGSLNIDYKEFGALANNSTVVPNWFENTIDILPNVFSESKSQIGTDAFKLYAYLKATNSPAYKEKFNTIENGEKEEEIIYNKLLSYTKQLEKSFKNNDTKTFNKIKKEIDRQENLLDKVALRIDSAKNKIGVLIEENNLDIPNNFFDNLKKENISKKENVFYQNNSNFNNKNKILITSPEGNIFYNPKTKQFRPENSQQNFFMN